MTGQATSEARELLTLAKQFRENAAALGTAPAAPGSIIGLWLRTADALGAALGPDESTRPHPVRWCGCRLDGGRMGCALPLHSQDPFDGTHVWTPVDQRPADHHLRPTTEGARP